MTIQNRLIGGDAIINDQYARVGEPVMEAMRRYEIIPVRWSLRGQVVKDLAA